MSDNIIDRVDGILQTTRDNIEDYWLEVFPDGKLPDRISFLISEISREFRKIYSQARKGE